MADRLPDYQALRALITERRTVNFFEPGPIAPELLEDVLDAARWAPNHRLTEPWKFLVPGPLTVAALIDLAVEMAAEKGEEAAVARRKRLEAIPNWLVVTSAIDDDDLVTQENYAACCCAVQNLALLLWQRGLGLKWTTGAVNRHPRLPEILDYDTAREQIVGLFWMGIAKKIPQSRRSPLSTHLRRLP